MSDVQVELIESNGWAAANIDGMGEGPGFRKIRRVLNVTEMGVNAIVMPPGIGSGSHWHDQQEEVYFVHAGTLKFTFGHDDSESVILGPGGTVRVDAATPRSVANVGDDEATYVVFGAAGGYIGRDAHHRENQPRIVQA